MLGIADEERVGTVLRHAEAVGANAPFPLRAFYPPIYAGDRDWREYFRSRNLNLQHQYHNGGIWPLIGVAWWGALGFMRQHPSGCSALAASRTDNVRVRG